MENLDDDEQLMAIRVESEFGSAKAAPSTPSRGPLRSTNPNALPGAAELHALCPAVSPAVSAQPPASPYMTHAEKEIRRLKAELEIAYGNLEDLRNREAENNAPGGSGPGPGGLLLDSAAVEKRVAEVRLECEEQWAEYFAESSIEAENIVEKLQGDLTSAL
jgi:hypothetical protein